MPHEWIWNNGVAVGVLVAIVLGIVWLARKAVMIVRWLRPWLEELLKSVKELLTSTIETNAKLQQAVDRQDGRAADQLQACQQHATELGVVGSDVKSQNRAILELLHGARIGLGQANIDEQLRQQIEKRISEAERIIQG